MFNVILNNQISQKHHSLGYGKVYSELNSNFILLV